MSGVTVIGAALGATLIALRAGVAIWSGWVGFGSLCGFGLVEPLDAIGGAAAAGIVRRADGSGWQPWAAGVAEGESDLQGGAGAGRAVQPEVVQVLCQSAGPARPGGLGGAQIQGEGDQALLGAVVQVAFD